MLDLGDDAAADDDGVGMRGDRPRAGGVANAEADADRQRDVAADLRELARDVGVSRWPAPVTPFSET